MGDQFFDLIHAGLNREGPGSDQTTLRAVKLIPDLPRFPVIADIGCGPGKSTMILATETRGKITAVDKTERYLETLAAEAIDRELDKFIDPQIGDMFDLKLPNNAYDLIWSEGAIYIIGLNEGLKRWRRHLKQGGYIACSHISWLVDKPAKVAADFWGDAYPAITTVEANVKAFRANGYEPLAHFAVPQADWWNEYYRPMLDRIDELRRRYPDNAEAQACADQCQQEIDVWRAAGTDFNYVFYIAKKF